MKKQKKITSFFLCIFLIVLLAACTDDSHSNNETSTATNEENGIDFHGTYDQNDLLIVSLEEKYSDVTVEIPQIEGLKDEAVQDKVNQDIYDRVKDAYKEFSELHYANYYTNANFSNVISIGVYIGADDAAKQIYLNYNLVNGERLTFEELFLRETDLLQIIRNAFYETLVQDQMMEDSETVISFDENKLYKLVKGYSNSEEKVFAFSPTEIFFYYQDTVASVKMQDIADQVTIYSKYVTQDSLYTRNDIGKKDIFTCVDLHEDNFRILEFGYLEENLWYDVTVWKDSLEDELELQELEQYRNFENGIYSKVYEKIEAYRKIAKENPDRFYIFLAKPYVYLEGEAAWIGDSWEVTYSKEARASENIQIFEMSQEAYETVYRDKLIEAYRYQYFAMQGGVQLESVVEKDVEIKEMTEEKLYDYTTGELME